MKLYHHPASPNSRKVLAVAKHLGVPLDLERVDIMKGEQQGAAFLAVNPNGMVPALVDGDLRLWESNAIMAYVAGKKDSALWPRSDARYDIMRWQSWELAHFGPACSIFIAENMIKPMMGQEPDKTRLDEGRKELARFAGVLDAHLTSRAYLVGDALTLADFSVAAVLGYASAAKIPLGDYASVRKWLGRLDEIPAWKETAPQG